MGGMNPFGVELGPSGPPAVAKKVRYGGSAIALGEGGSSPSGPSGRGPVLTRDAAAPGGSARRGRATQDGGPSYETRRSDLYPEVRDLADKLHARILGICQKYGAKDIRGMLENAEAGKGPKLKRKDVEEISKLLDALNFALVNNELPEQRELPPLEAFEKMVEEVGRALPHHQIIGLDDWDRYQYTDGRISGRIEVIDLFNDVGPGHYWLPVIQNRPITSVNDINGKAVALFQCHDIHDTNGKLNGSMLLDGKTIPFISGEPMWTIKDKRGVDVAIVDCLNIHNVDGKLNGAVKLQHSWWLPVINGELIEDIEDWSGAKKSIRDMRGVRNVHGKLNGLAMLTDNNMVPVVDGVAISNIVTDAQGKAHNISNFSSLYVMDGKLNGLVSYLDETKLYVSRPIIGGRVRDRVMDKDGVSRKFVSGYGFVRKGQLNGAVVTLDKRTLPVVDGVMVATINDHDGQPYGIADSSDVRIVDGKINGKIKLLDGKWFPAIEGRLVQEIEGQEIIFSDKFAMSTTGGVFNGTVNVERSDGKIASKNVLLGKFID